MRSQETCRLPEPIFQQDGQLTPYDLVISSGGAAAVLGGTGCLLACELAGLKSFRRIGGVSGGSLVAALSAAGLRSNDLVKLALATSFSKYLKLEHGIFGIVGDWFGIRKRSAAHNREFQHNCRWNGLTGSDALGHFIEKMMAVGTCRRTGKCNAETGSVWPNNFWTMATTRSGGQIVFDADGVHHIPVGGQKSCISNEPPSTGTALRASCTIPGLMASVEYKGIRLYDGAMSRDGICPVGAEIRHFGANPSKMIACRINDDLHQPIMGALHGGARLFCGLDPNFHWGPECEGVIDCHVKIDHVHTLKFHLSDDAKWMAILIGFHSTLTELALHGILRGDALAKAQSVLRCVGFWRDLIPARIGAPQVLADRVSGCFTEHGLL